MALAVLVVDDEPTLAKSICTYLARHGYETTSAGSAEEGLEKLDRFRPDIVLLDFHLRGINGLEALARIRGRAPDAKVVMITGHSSVKVAVDALKAGAEDYLPRPVVLGELKRLLERLVGQERLRQALGYYNRRERRGAELAAIVGDSPAMTELKESIARLLRSESRMTAGPPPAVLLTGEAGTGKGLVARALHYGGPRAERAFIELDCASIPAQPLESELFGHERGAFAGARARRAGLAEAAHGGTLFLDEIGATEPALQAKLLKLIEEKTVQRLGSVRDMPVDVRIIATTHQPLDERIREGRFRADLFYRMRGVQLRVPPLRVRGADVMRLARHFLAEQAQRHGRPGLAFDPPAERALLAHTWPGNVRELRNMVEEAVLLARDERIGARELAAIATAAEPSATVASLPAQGVDLEQVERDLVEQALARTGWNVTRSAKLLGLTRDTLRYRIEKYGLEQDSALE